MADAAKPDVEFRRRVGLGYRTYGSVYFRPLRVFLFGRWLVGKPGEDR